MDSDDEFGLDLDYLTKKENEISRLLEKTKILEGKLSSFTQPPKTPNTNHDRYENFKTENVTEESLFPQFNSNQVSKKIRFSHHVPEKIERTNHHTNDLSTFNPSNTLHFSIHKPEVIFNSDSTTRTISNLPKQKKKKVKKINKSIYQTGDLLNAYMASLKHYEKGEFETSMRVMSDNFQKFGYKNLDDKKLLSNIFLLLGNNYFHLEKYEKSIENYQRIFEILDNNSNNNDITKIQKKNFFFITPNMNLGLVYIRIHDYDNALESLLKALKYTEECSMIGKDRLIIGDIYHNIGVVFDKQNNIIGALKMYEKAEKIKVKILGKNHVKTALTYENISLIFMELRKFKISIEYMKKVLDVRKSFEGMDSRSYVRALHKMGLVYFQYRNYSKALYYVNKAYEMRMNLLGKNHSLTKDSFVLRKKILKKKKIM